MKWRFWHRVVPDASPPSVAPSVVVHDGASIFRALDNDEYKLMRAGFCAFCKGREFLNGPSGGMSMNIKCANVECGAEYNLGFGVFEVGPIDLIRNPLQMADRTWVVKVSGPSMGKGVMV
jgi:hypothetical protein